MEVIVKNIIDKIQKCVLFSHYDRCFKAIKSENDFLCLDTGNGVEIYIDGDKDEKKRLKFLKSLSDNPYKYSSIEFTDVDELISFNFRVMNTDANGDIFIKNVYSSNHIKPYQETKYPIVIEHEKLKGIDSTTAFIFYLKPQQEIKLKFIQ